MVRYGKESMDISEGATSYIYYNVDNKFNRKMILCPSKTDNIKIQVKKCYINYNEPSLIINKF